MKLRICEDEEPIFYVDFIKDDGTFDLNEEQIMPDEVILKGNQYFDELDTRKSLAEYLDSLKLKLSVYPYVERVHVKKSKAKTGLSNYVQIIFKHPKGISDEEVIAHYRYSIRFSDHLHEDAKKDPRILDSLEVVGMKPKNFEKSGIRVFNRAIADVQNEIKQYEIQKYGKQLTFF